MNGTKYMLKVMWEARASPIIIPIPQKFLFFKIFLLFNRVGADLILGGITQVL
jgi:hypothetical protein